MVAPGMLQNPSVRKWLGGIEPAWTLLDQASFAALHRPPSPTAGPIRLASDLAHEELRQSAVARNALVLLRAGGFRTFSVGGNCSVYFLHGALHLFLDDQLNTQKRIATNATIVDDITGTIRRLRKLPVFVAEGTAAQKMRKINSVPYLRHGYEQLKERSGSLFIYGHSAGDKDNHIYSAIACSPIDNIYFCVFRPADNFVEMQAQLAPFAVRNPDIELKYIDAGTVNVWGGAA